MITPATDQGMMGWTKHKNTNRKQRKTKGMKKICNTVSLIMLFQNLHLSSDHCIVHILKIKMNNEALQHLFNQNSL